MIEIKADLTVSQVAKILQRSRSSIDSLIRSGKLEAYDASPDGRYRQWRIPPEALDRFRERHQVRPPQARKKRVATPVKRYV